MLFDDLLYPEGPRWHDEHLWLSDEHAHRVWRIDLEGRGEIVAELEDCPSGLGFLPDGSPLVDEMCTQRLFRIGPSGRLTLHAALSHHGRGWLNDMIVDARGRA